MQKTRCELKEVLQLKCISFILPLPSNLFQEHESSSVIGYLLGLLCGRIPRPNSSDLSEMLCILNRVINILL